MVKCNQCNKFVHSDCDPEASLTTYHAKKEANSDYEYSCPTCKAKFQNGRMIVLRRNNNIDDDIMQAPPEILSGVCDSDNVSLASFSASDSLEKCSLDFGLGKGKSLQVYKFVFMN